MTHWQVNETNVETLPITSHNDTLLFSSNSFLNITLNKVGEAICLFSRTVTSSIKELHPFQTYNLFVNLLAKKTFKEFSLSCVSFPIIGLPWPITSYWQHILDNPWHMAHQWIRNTSHKMERLKYPVWHRLDHYKLLQTQDQLLTQVKIRVVTNMIQIVEIK